MSLADHSCITLRIFGDDLVPEEITARLGASPTDCKLKGEKSLGAKTGRTYVAETGRWLFSTPTHEPEDLDGQIRELFDQIPADIAVWKKLTAEFEVDLFCGLFMSRENNGVSLSAEALALLGERGIQLELDIYGSSDDDEADESTGATS